MNKHGPNKSQSEKRNYKSYLKKETPFDLTDETPKIGFSDETIEDTYRISKGEPKYKNYNKQAKWIEFIKNKIFETIISIVCLSLLTIIGFNYKIQFNLNREIGELTQNVDRNLTEISDLKEKVSDSVLNNQNINDLSDKIERINECINEIKIDLAVINEKIKK